MVHLSVTLHGMSHCIPIAAMWAGMTVVPKLPIRMVRLQGAGPWLPTLNLRANGFPEPDVKTGLLTLAVGLLSLTHPPLEGRGSPKSQVLSLPPLPETKAVMRNTKHSSGRAGYHRKEGRMGGRSLVSLFQQEDHSQREKGVRVKWRQGAGLEGPS